MSTPPSRQPPVLDYRRAYDREHRRAEVTSTVLQWVAGFFVPFAVFGSVLLLAVNWPIFAMIWLVCSVPILLLVNLYLCRRFDWRGLFPGALVGIAALIVLWCGGLFIR